MEKTSMLLIIVQRKMEKDFIDLLVKNDIATVFSAPCQGTAGTNVLAMLGLEIAEKTLLSAMATRARAKRAMREMVSNLGINLPGYGIAMAMPIGSVGGGRSLKYLMGEQIDAASGVNEMEEKREFPYDLIVAIAQRDTSDLVMEAARNAKAGGGTILHAKGAAETKASKFLGFSIAPEKEMILIVVRHEQKDDVMRAIMKDAGPDSEAHAAVFSVPVESVAGLRSLMDEEE